MIFFPYGYPSKIFEVGEKLQTKSFLQLDLYVCKLAFTEEFRSLFNCFASRLINSCHQELDFAGHL